MTARELVEAMGGKWSGGHGLVRCPIHKERTPSCSISAGRTQPILAKCFGCGANGTTILPVLRDMGILPVEGKRSRVPYNPTPPEPESPKIDAPGMMRRWHETTDLEMLGAFATSLGVSFDSLHLLGTAWASDKNAWAFPMRNGAGEIIGIRLRAPNGDKWTVKGSKSGLFVPAYIPTGQTLWCVEGASDAAAAITLGLYAVGRPSCQGCEEMVATLAKRLRIAKAVIIADKDGPGLSGAAKLQAMMPVECITITPTASKDLRVFLRRGGTREMLESKAADISFTRSRMAVSK